MEDDEQLSAELLGVLKPVDQWLSRISPEGPRSLPEVRSGLADDDEHAQPFQISHAAWHSLVHAVDNLHLLRLVLRDLKIVPMFALYPLARSALENASIAVWLLAHPEQKERLKRRLRLAAANVQAVEAAARTLNIGLPTSHGEHVDLLLAVARREGIDKGSLKESRLPMGELVKAAGGHTPVTARSAEFVWRMCSAFGHGDQWPTQVLSQLDALSGATEGVVHARVAADANALLLSTMTAIRMTLHAWRLYDQRSQAPRR